MKALPWIIIGLIVVAVIYYLYKKSVAQKALVANGQLPNGVTPITCPTGKVPSADNLTCISAPSIINPNQTTAPVSTSTAPPVIAGSTLAGASCLNTKIVVNLINEFKNSGPLQIFKRQEIKETIGSICPEALRYLTR